MSGRRQKMKSRRAMPSIEAQHRPALDQRYRSYELPLFEHEWPIYLDLVLLDAMCIFGPESWHEIAIYLNCTFTVEQIRDHYYRVYGGHQTETKLPDMQRMLIANEEDDIYIAAHKREELRVRDMARRRRGSDDIEQPKTQEKVEIKKVPGEFGYEQHKKIFAQPFNEEAQVMIIGLRIGPEDDQKTRASKIHVLKQYDKLVTERSIVEQQVMDNNLMECMYSLNKSSLTIMVPQPVSSSSIGNSSKRRKKSGKKEKETDSRQNLFFSIRRKVHEDLCEPFHVVYMKIAKYDHGGKMKSLLKEYQHICEDIRHEKQSLTEDI